MPSPELLDTIRASLAERDIDGDTLVQRSEETIFPMSEVASARLSEALLGEAPPEGYALRGTLGEGGTGVVRLGEQRALGRPVAIKMLRPNGRSPIATADLLREAWVTGALEHPNIVPVHDIALDENGAPMVILKKIEGTNWSMLMHDLDRSEPHRGASDLLEWNLRVLMQVCDAVHFAHARGVLHRDLKPENVMIGEHGEVYVVDWGLAVSFGDDHGGRLSRAEDANQLAGTPAYMAPEMLGGLGELLSPRTDVYLLGAILFDIVTGEPPHRGDTLLELVRRITATPPEVPKDVPSELAALIGDAMHFDPVERPESAQAFRLVLESYLRHRDAGLLAGRAETQLSRLAALTADGDTDEHEVHNAYGECRYGFRHALELWPESEVAGDGLARAVELMVAYELGRDEPRTAKTLIAAHPDPPADLVERVELALVAQENERSRLAALGDALDPSTGRRARYVFGAAIGVLFVAQPIVTGVRHQLGTAIATNAELFVSNAIAFVIFVALAWWVREALRASRINRFLTAGLLTAIASNATLRATDMVRGADVLATTNAQVLVWIAILVMIAAVVDLWFVLPAMVFALAFVVSTFQPQLAFYGIAVGNIVLVVTGLLITARAKSPVPPAQHEV